MTMYEGIMNSAAVEETEPAATANVELKIQEDTASLVRTAEDILTLIRQMQELWLFGSLDTLTKPADEEAAEAQALEIAKKIETIVKKKEDLGIGANGDPIPEGQDKPREPLEQGKEQR
ncbi:hypothetical protein GQ43DRAFT_20384 [Delitschia confertaspora ATCC 74209]|uniref:Uncharacterized protein n=1 Tax=Delitschia confertaspora ATCC 74209 TaxID=1513339 RepID=A0A9P4MT75_9PLEO|nr:hypothetical protein GQ43DRAFT_20384 [Delitschia confertaspora ATCC 74209]